MYFLYQQHRIGYRPVWLVALLSTVTASLYATWWTFQTMRELQRCRQPPDTHGPARDGFEPGATAAALVAAAGFLACEAWTLGTIASAPWAGASDTSLAWLAAGAAAWTVTLWTLATMSMRIREIAQSTRATVAWNLPLTGVSLVLLALALLVGGAGLYETGPLAPWEAVSHVLTTGLVLPLWTIWLQAALFDALRPLGLQTPILESTARSSAHRPAMLQRMRAHEIRRVLPGPLDVRAPRAALPRISLALAAVCCVMFVVELVVLGFEQTPDELLRLGAESVDTVFGGEWWRLAAAQVLHFGAAHFAFNIFWLLLLGWYLERAVGHRMTAAVVAAAAVGSAAVSTLGRLAAPEVVSVGASGIVFGVMGAAVAVDPHATSTVGRTGRWMSVLGVASSLSPMIDRGAHLGGFAAGWLLIYLQRQRGQKLLVAPRLPPAARPPTPPPPPLPPAIPGPPPIPPNPPGR